MTNDGDSITRFLGAIRRVTTGTNTRVMIVSRDEPEIRHCLSNDGSFNPVFEHRITPEDVRDDVVSYSRSIVNAKLPKKPDTAKEDIT